MNEFETQYLKNKGRMPEMFTIKGTIIQTETDGTPKQIKPIAGATIRGGGKNFEQIKSDLIEVAEKNPDFRLTIKPMKHYDRSKIEELPTERCEQCRLKPCEICCHPIIDADKTQSEQLTTRISIRRMK